MYLGTFGQRRRVVDTTKSNVTSAVCGQFGSDDQRTRPIMGGGYGTITIFEKEFEMMSNCQRCGGGDVSWSHDQVKFFSGVVARLCPGCQTEVNLLIMQLPEWSQVMEVNARLAHGEHSAQAGKPYYKDDILAIACAGNSARIAIHPKIVELLKRLPNKATAALKGGDAT